MFFRFRLKWDKKDAGSDWSELIAFFRLREFNRIESGNRSVRFFLHRVKIFIVTCLSKNEKKLTVLGFLSGNQYSLTIAVLEKMNLSRFLTKFVTKPVCF